MKAIIITTLLSIILIEQIQAQTGPTKIKVYLLGTFHFTQSDTTVYDLSGERNQKSISKLSDIIVGLHPDKIFIEKWQGSENEKFGDSLYQEYKKGNLSSARNGLWQVGASTAMKLNHQKLYQCGKPANYSIYYRVLKEYVKSHNQWPLLEEYSRKAMPRPITSTFNSDSLGNKSDLLDYLRWLNSDDFQNPAHAQAIDVYSPVGNMNACTPAKNIDSTCFSGTDQAIDWYCSNTLIYSGVISQLDFTEKAIILIIGNDHVPAIRQMFEANPFFKVMNTEQWLGKTTIQQERGTLTLRDKLNKNGNSIEYPGPL
jgi:hypothetical protein